MKQDSLSDHANRLKARWLKRVMYESSATPTQKCVAFAIADHLNCVTLDSWPAHARLARLLGRKSSKTPQRAARGLEALGLITLRRDPRLGSSYRYAPVFTAADKSVRDNGHPRPDNWDANVHQSFLGILPRKSSSTASRNGNNSEEHSAPRSFDRARRGEFEVELAKRLGRDGFSILERLASIDDRAVERLCAAISEGSLGDRELAAARLAAEQVRS